MFGEVCSNHTHSFLWGNETILFDHELECTVSKTVFILFSFIGIAGLVGNALVVLVVAANPMMRSTTNILIINLAVADLLFVIFCVPATGFDYVLASWPFGSVWCSFVQYMIVVTCHASVYTLVLMSLDRFLAVVHPISSISIRTQRNALLAIIVTWLIVTTTAFPVFISHGEVEYHNHRNEINTACLFLTDDGNIAIFQISFFLSSYVIPLTLISILYISMLIRLWHSVPGSKVSAESRRGKKRVTRMVVFVVLAFAVCWLPIHIVLVLKSLQMYETSRLGVSIQIFSHVLAYTNSFINPILYNCFSENFRKAFRKIVWCGKPIPLGTTGAQITKAGTTRTTTAAQNGGISPPAEFL
ncbi:allatostatin-A receptor-like isoform X2 [Chironomus tepperi]|uniref:allatostatin-A receptor-like isoform X2 n=1 Tax=Chironomus tepperi TaxID=113505 RepID=UPI00391F3A72